MNRYTFKAKREYENTWVYGDLIDNKFIFNKNEIDYYDEELGIIDGSLIEIIPETLCQCTGLKDRDGNYIFENDIIDINQTVNGCNLFKIVWDKYKWNAEYYVKMTTPRLYEYNFEELLDINDFEKDIKIIGNKFDKEED